MIKRTLYFGNPANLNTHLEQFVVNRKDQPDTTVPIEDIGIVVIDHYGVNISQMLMAKLLEHNVALIVCDEKHLPTGLMLNLNGHQLQSARFKAQIEASQPLKKQLWQQTVSAKLYNQGLLLNKYTVRDPSHDKVYAGDYLIELSKQVKSGDAGNLEAQGAAWYWKHIFKAYVPGFIRLRAGAPPNNLLNYGYAILRAMVARSLVGSGLLPTLGIFHRNQYNAYCLADDIMEPYRPYIDELVLQHVRDTLGEPRGDKGSEGLDLTPALKQKLLQSPTLTVYTDGEEGPLMVHINRSTASLARCFEGEVRRIAYPEFK